MRTSQKITIALFASVIVASGIATVWSLNAFLNPGRGDVPMAPAPTQVVTTPSVQPQSTLPTSTQEPEPLPAAPAMMDIDGVPVHIEIRQGAGVLASSEIVPITLEDDGKLVPPAGLAAVYYSETDWNTIPGNLDTYRGIIAGHNIFDSGAPDVFFNLGQVKQGDIIILTYKLNESGALVTAEFTASADAVSAPKADVVNSEVETYRHIWLPAAEFGRYLTVLSCDLATANLGEHALNNWVVDAIRTK